MVGCRVSCLKRGEKCLFIHERDMNNNSYCAHQLSLIGFQNYQSNRQFHSLLQWMAVFPIPPPPLFCRQYALVGLQVPVLESVTLNSLLSNAYQKLGLKKHYLWEFAWRICRPFLYIFLDHQSGTPTLQCFALFILLLDPKSLSLNCSLILWHQPMEKVIVSLRCLL